MLSGVFTTKLAALKGRHELLTFFGYLQSLIFLFLALSFLVLFIAQLPAPLAFGVSPWGRTFLTQPRHRRSQSSKPHPLLTLPLTVLLQEARQAFLSAHQYIVHPSARLCRIHGALWRTPSEPTSAPARRLAATRINKQIYLHHMNFFPALIWEGMSARRLHSPRLCHSVDLMILSATTTVISKIWTACDG